MRFSFRLFDKCDVEIEEKDEQKYIYEKTEDLTNQD